MNNYLAAIKQNVCSICVDSTSHGVCTLSDKEVCAVEHYLPQIINVIHNSESEDNAGIYKLLKETICENCHAHGSDGSCYLHDDANCSLDRYYSIIIETIKKVDAGKI